MRREVAIFIKTNMGTHLAIPVSPDITILHFKRELEEAHIECFRELGKVICLSVMVKQKSNFYHMPDFLPIKHAFKSCEKVWFVHVDVSPSNKLEICSAPGTGNPVRKATRLHANDHMKLKKNDGIIKHKKGRIGALQFARVVMCGFLSANYSTRKKRKRKRRNVPRRAHKEDNMGVQAEYVVAHRHVPDACKGEQNDQPTLLRDSINRIETPCESLSGVASVSGIIDKYFSSLVELDQVDSQFTPRDEKNQLKKLEDAENSSPRMPMSTKRLSLRETNKKLLVTPSPHASHSVGSRHKYERSEVGERLVVASNSLQKTPKSNLGKKFFEAVADSTAAGQVFEIDDDGDDD